MTIDQLQKPSIRSPLNELPSSTHIHVETEPSRRYLVVVLGPVNQTPSPKKRFDYHTRSAGGNRWTLDVQGTTC
ncbi:hypothetical protein BY996DRAFT_6476596 [Phakopsora pachyrhizi]|nr:hypothetical protein BY996DRAFT_6476596 [Phakopsora pachyrhizi]